MIPRKKYKISFETLGHGMEKAATMLSDNRTENYSNRYKFKRT